MSRMTMLAVITLVLTACGGGERSGTTTTLSQGPALQHSAGLLTNAISASNEPLYTADPPLGDSADVGDGYNFSTYDTTSMRCVTGTASNGSPDYFTSIGRIYDKSSVAEGSNISGRAQAAFLKGSLGGSTQQILNHSIVTSSEDVAFRFSATITRNWLTHAPSANEQVGYLRTLQRLDRNPIVAQTRAEFQTVGVDLDLPVSQIALQPIARALLLSNRSKFIRDCGMGYVRHIDEGIDIVGFLHRDTSDSKADDQLKRHLGASFFGIGGSVDLNSTLHTLHDSDNFAMEFYQMGGDSPVSGQTPDQFIQAEHNLDVTKMNHLHQYQLTIQLYGPDSISNWPAGVPAMNSETQTPLATLLAQYFLVTQIRNDARFIEQNPDQFLPRWLNGNPSPSSNADVIAVENEANQWASQLNADAVNCDNGSCPAPMTKDDFNRRYYGLVARLPLPRAFDAYYALRDAANTAATDVQQYPSQAYAAIVYYQAMPWAWRPSNDDTCYHRNQAFHNMFSDAAYSKISAAVGAVQSLNNTFPDAYKDEWVRRITDMITVRCGELPGHSSVGCIDDPNAISSLRATVPTTAPHGIDTNAIPESGNYLYDECKPKDMRFNYDV